MAYKEASEGYWLYNGKMFTKTINSADVSDWYEVTDEYRSQFVDTDTEELRQAKDSKIADITAYDSSSAVNSFEYAGQQMWVDRDTRVSLRDTAKIEADAGMATSTLWTDSGAITLPPLTIVQLLSAIEIYAHQCYNVTQQHIANVKALQSVEDVEAYDYTQGYPQKLTFGNE